MAAEVVYVLSGRGYSLHWDVEAEIAERYYARVSKVPSRHEFTAGDTLYMPTNTIHQHFNSNDDEPLRLLSGQNRIFRYLGYDNVTSRRPPSTATRRSPGKGTIDRSPRSPSAIDVPLIGSGRGGI
jgi:hypothetical protein